MESPPVLPWLLGCAALTETPIAPVELNALGAVSRTLAQPHLPDNLLPRAAALIPQLIALLRQTDLPTPAIAERIGKDSVLSAEVMRLASSPYYRAQGEVGDLEQAINRIGLHGLETVIARVLLKPIYGAAPGPLSARVGPRMWDHSEALARHVAILANASGQPVFDAYVAGILHDTGWTIALNIIDRAGLQLPVPPSQAFGAALTEHAHRLFGLAARRWDITPGFTTLAQDARDNGMQAASHPLGLLLRQAQQPCLEELAST
ncbi:MAG: HDOD domain-containing protein [Burkholderiaceae bacterium]